MNIVCRFNLILASLVLLPEYAICGDEYRPSTEYSIGDFELQDISLSPDGKRFAAAIRSSKLLVCDTHSGKKCTELNLKSSAIWCRVYFLDDKLLGSCSDSGDIAVWNVAKEEVVASLQLDTPCTPVIFPRDNSHTKLLYGAPCLNGIVLHDLREKKSVATYSGDRPCGTIAISVASDRDVVQSVNFVGELQSWSSTTRKQIGNFELGKGILRATFSYDGAELFLLKAKKEKENQKEDEYGVIVQAKTGKELFIKKMSTPELTCVSALKSHSGFVCGFSDGSLAIFDKSGLHPISQDKGKHTSAVTSISVSPNDDTILSGSSSGRIKLWSLVQKTK